MIDPAKKTVFHSALVQNGPTEVTIKGDPQESKFKKGTFYVVMSINGSEHQYTVENDACGAALTGYRGQTVTLTALGSREDATIEVDGISVGQGQPAPQQRQAAPAQRPSQHIPTPAAQPQQQQEPPQQQQRGNTRQAPSQDDLMNEARNTMMQIINLHLMVAKAVAKYEVPQFKKLTGHDMSEGQQQAATASVFITCERSGLVRQMPTSPLA